VVEGPQRDSYTAETLSIAVVLGCFLAVIFGFIAGWGCAKKCRKDQDNIPYPDTEYEYFEQRHNLNINTYVNIRCYFIKVLQLNTSFPSVVTKPQTNNPNPSRSLFVT
jgi:hypothetical protein